MVGGIFRTARPTQVLRRGSASAASTHSGEWAGQKGPTCTRAPSWGPVEDEGGSRWSDVGNGEEITVRRNPTDRSGVCCGDSSAPPQPVRPRRCRDPAGSAGSPSAGSEDDVVLAPETTMPRLLRAGASDAAGTAEPYGGGRGQRRGSSPARFSQRCSILRRKVPSPPEVVGPVPPPPSPGEPSPSEEPPGAVTA